jgi:protein required for attachment to host cells
MTTDLILIANGNEARLLAHTDAELVVLDTVLRTEGRPPPAAPPPDAQRAGEAAAPGERRTSRPPLDPVRRRMRAFAGEVARRFEQAASEQSYARVALFAACPFLSEVMRQLSPALKKTLRAVVDADISELALSDAQRRIEQELDAGLAPVQGRAPDGDPQPGQRPETAESSLAA